MCILFISEIGSHHVFQHDFELMIILTQPIECRDYRQVLLDPPQGSVICIYVSHEYTCIYIFKGQRSTLGVIFEVLSTFETDSLT